MEKILIEFINTLDLSLKKLQEEVGDSSGFSRLTVSQLRYVDAIYDLEHPTITEIAEQMVITKASVTAGIHKLAKLGFVVKTQSSEDKRVFRVQLTEAGEKLVQAKYQALKEYGKFIAAALTEREARQLEATLTKLVVLFKQGKAGQERKPDRF